MIDPNADNEMISILDPIDFETKVDLHQATRHLTAMRFYDILLFDFTEGRF